ncbi:hypothetical protein ACFZCU_45100 [Streptomyces canus]|uniref:hypothetical protein n=1 Tax=Streptomyces canus TaxID=58343 RepID=UPI0036E80609
MAVFLGLNGTASAVTSKHGTSKPAATASPKAKPRVSAAVTPGTDCAAARDDDYSSGPATGTFAAAGDAVCLTLPTATGNGLYLVNEPPSGGVTPEMTVFDSQGAQQCDSGYAFSVCKLTGTAPFQVVLTAPDAGAYRVTIQRTGDTSGCTAWPQSAFGGAWGVQVPLTADHQTACLAIGADQHSTAELFDFTNTTNQLNASVQVYDRAGDKVCATLGGSTAACQFTPGTAYAALLVGTGTADTYKLVRRDVSPTANCAAPSSLTVGGPSTTYSFTSALDSRCLRVTAATTDKLWLSARTPTATDGAGAMLGVVDASGKLVCRQGGISCRATGSTSYVVFVLASGFAGTPITAHVDTWRIGTSSGWASQCTEHVVSPDGFSLRSGTFTESATAYCAVIQMQPSQDFEVYGTHSSTTTATPWVSLLSNTRYSGTYVDYAYQCNGDNVGTFSFNCLTTSSADAGQYALVVTPAEADTPVEYSMQGVCQFGCSTPPKQAGLTSVSPASGPTGTENQVVLHGANLTLGTQVELASDHMTASAYPSEPVSVSPDGTSLTVRIGTYDVAPGTYDVVIPGTGYAPGTYLTGAYTVTAAPAATPGRLVPLAPTRFLDTRNGTGAPKQRVGAGGVVKLKVAGVHGVPTSGVTAVVMNVTAVKPSTSGYVTVYPDGKPVPAVSNLNFTTGETIPNLVIVPVIDGTVDLRNASGTVDLVADVTGWFSSAGSTFTSSGPVRLLDTRSGLGARIGTVGPGGIVSLQVGGVDGVPSSGVTAVVLNVTVTGPTAGSYLTVYPHGRPLPAVSNLNFTTGETISNLVVVPVVDGRVTFANHAGDVHVVADLNGYFSG